MGKNPLLAICIIFIAVVTGYFLGDGSPEISRLRAELREANLKSQAAKQNRSPRVFQKTSGMPQPSVGTLTNMSEFALDAGVTAEDVAATRELERQRKEGKFILKNERPLFKKLQNHDFKMISVATAAEKAQEYARTFFDLGIDVKTATELQDHLAKIHQASLEAETSIDQAVDARKKYDERLRSLLTDEAYAEYIQYELAKPARSELERIKDFASQRTVPIEATGEERIVRVLLDTGVVYGGMSDGPYGLLPNIPMNTEEALLQTEQELRALVASANEANIRLAGEPAISESDRQTIADYLSDKVNKKQALMDSLKNPHPRPAPRRLSK
jgi:hypothetical protein